MGKKMGQRIIIDGITRVLAFSTTAVLGNAGVYTSPTIDSTNYNLMNVTTLSDQAGGYILQHSNDGITWVSAANNAQTANVLRTDNQTAQRKYMRIVYTNGATPQGSLDIAAYLRPL